MLICHSPVYLPILDTRSVVKDAYFHLQINIFVSEMILSILLVYQMCYWALIAQYILYPQVDQRLCQLIKDLPIKDSEVIRFIEQKVGAIS